MKRLRYNVAASLDGFIADPNGDYDWIPMDPTIDFGALFNQFDVFVLGRRTFETLRAQGVNNPLIGKQIVVASRTMSPLGDDPFPVVTDKIVERVTELKQETGKDIWLFGGGELFRCLLDAGLVDSVEVAVVPILLSEGVPLLPPGQRSSPLKLASSQVLPSGIVMLSYDVPSS